MSSSVSQNLQHGLVCLLLAEELGGIVPVLVLVYDNMLRGRLQTVLDAAVAGDGLLVGARMEETNIQRVAAVFHYRQEDRVGVRVRIVIVLAVTREPAEEHPLVLVVPFVYREKNEALFDTPCVRKRGHEGIVDHIPALAVVLLLYVQYLEYGGPGLADSETSELGENVRLGHSAGIAR